MSVSSLYSQPLLTKSLGMPPACKADNPFSHGYEPYDLWDLGEFDQKGGVATRWGTKQELLELCNEAHELGIGIYFDTVLNKKGEYAWTTACNGLTLQQLVQTESRDARSSK